MTTPPGRRIRKGSWRGQLEVRVGGALRGHRERELAVRVVATRQRPGGASRRALVAVAAVPRHDDPDPVLAGHGPRLSADPLEGEGAVGVRLADRTGLRRRRVVRAERLEADGGPR